MMKRVFVMISTHSVLALLMVFGLVWSAGCGGTTGSETPTVSSADAQNAAGASALVGTQAIVSSLAAMRLNLDLSKDAAEGLVKTAFTATPTGSCTERQLPSLSSGALASTLYGSEFTCQNYTGSGSCSVLHDETSENTGKAIMNCSNLVVPVQVSASDSCSNVTLNGRIGVDYTLSYSGSNTTFDIDFSSDSLKEASLDCFLGLAYSMNQCSWWTPSPI